MDAILDFHDDGDDSHNAEALQNRVDHLEILESLLRERIRSVEKQNAQELELKAAGLAENKRLQREIDNLERNGTNDAMYRTITPEEGSSVRAGGHHPNSKSAGSKKRNAKEETDSASGLETDDSAYEGSPNTPKARKASRYDHRRDAQPVSKKPKNVTTQPKRNYHFDEADYELYICPADGCTKKVWFAKKDNPPLNSDGMVCDQEPWCKSVFANKVSAMRRHMTEKHPQVPVVNFPPGFANRATSKKAR